MSRRTNHHHHHPSLLNERYLFRIYQDVYWSEDVTQTCFIPYDSESLLEEMPVSSKLEPPASALAKAAPPFNRWTVQANASINPDLEFLRNKHVVFSCRSSIPQYFLAFQY